MYSAGSSNSHTLYTVQKAESVIWASTIGGNGSKLG